MQVIFPLPMVKTGYEDVVYEDITSETEFISATAPIAINLFDDNGNLLSYFKCKPTV